MSEPAMDTGAAQLLVRSLLRRFLPDANGNFELHGPITPEEVEAMRLLADSPASNAEPTKAADATEHKAKRRRFGVPASVTPSMTLDLKSLTANPEEEGDVAAIDFGTAYSKAALWRARSTTPTPLDLQVQISDRNGNMLESSVYVTEGVLHFGPRAEMIFREENSPERILFDSPKQELSLLTGGTLQQIAEPGVDPTGSLTKRDLLTLYLAYLTAATSSALEAVKADRYTLRRFAVPVWKAEKLAAVSRLLKRLLVDAQILADTLPATVWHEGLAVSDAKRILDQIGSLITDQKRDDAKFISGHVVEAAAAAAAIGEKLANRRPVALIMDVGAGTTDIGLYRFSLPRNNDWKIAPFIGCQGALTLAGRALDERLIQFIRASAAIDPNSTDGHRVQWALRRDIRQHKASLFSAGFVDIEELEGRRFQLDEFLASPAVNTFRDDLKRQVTALLSQVGRDHMVQPDGLFGVVTGGGANVSIFRDLFSAPFELDDGRVHFAFLDASPDWLTDYTPDIRGIFPQLAVSTGACSPYLPDERQAVSDASVAPPHVVHAMYRS